MGNKEVFYKQTEHNIVLNELAKDLLVDFYAQLNKNMDYTETVDNNLRVRGIEPYTRKDYFITDKAMKNILWEKYGIYIDGEEARCIVDKPFTYVKTDDEQNIVLTSEEFDKKIHDAYYDGYWNGIEKGREQGTVKYVQDPCSLGFYG